MDVRVIGAGISGLTAATILAREGARVRVYEQARRVGSRFHSDFQGLENWSTDLDVLDELSEIGIAHDFETRAFHGITFVGPDGERVPVNTRRPLFYLVRRGNGPGSLDAALERQALDAGVEIVYGRRVDRWAGPAIVGTGPKRADGIVVGYIMETDLPDQAVGVVSNRLAPWGYAYFLAWGGTATLATVICRNFRSERRYLERTVRFFQEQLGIHVRNGRAFGGYGNYFRLRRRERRGKLYVGECAGLQDPLWGFGMRFAFRSGALAARSILTGEPYEELCSRALDDLLRAGLLNRIIWCAGGHLGYRLFLRALRDTSDPRELFQRAYQPGPVRTFLGRLAHVMAYGRLHVVFCNHVKCSCVWCRHRGHF
jgi:flavin-dependent dehydrogenase